MSEVSILPNSATGNTRAHPLAVTVLSIRMLSGAGALRAFANIQVGPLEIDGCRIVQQAGQQAWVSLPQSETKDAQGNRKFWPVVKCLDRNLKDAIDEAVLDAWAAQGGAT